MILHSSNTSAPVPEIQDLDRNLVYEPSDDTYLFLDALQQELPHIHSTNRTFCVEIGCGSGVVMTYLAKVLGNDFPMFYYGVDINPHATSTAFNTARINDISRYDIIQMDLLNSLKRRLHQKIDILLFNPPYVPTDSDEVGSRGIEAAWAGGVNGREVIDRILLQIKDLLSPCGIFYMVVVEENIPKQIIKFMQLQGFRSEVRC